MQEGMKDLECLMSKILRVLLGFIATKLTKVGVLQNLLVLVPGGTQYLRKQVEAGRWLGS